MMDFMFFVKTVALTVVLVMFMQIQVGEATIERHTLTFVQSSMIAQPLNSVARGAAKMVHDLTQTIWNGVHHNVGKKKKEEAHSRSSSFFWQHSAKQASSKSED